MEYPIPWGPRSSPSVWRAAGQCPLRMRIQAGATTKLAVAIWKLEPPAGLRASDLGKQENEDGPACLNPNRASPARWTVDVPDHPACPTPVLDEAGSGAASRRGRAPVRQTEEGGRGREKATIRP